MLNIMNGCINNALALKGVYPEIYRIKATYFCCDVEVGTGAHVILHSSLPFKINNILMH